MASNCVSIKPPDKCNPELYAGVSSRRISYDNMLWQAPVLSLTAQAFLLTISLGADTEPWARIVAGVLALVAAVAAVQLMCRHRAFERVDSDWLEEYEKKHFDGCIVNCGGRVSGTSSFVVWRGTLVVFAIAAAFAVVKGILATCAS